VGDSAHGCSTTTVVSSAIGGPFPMR
jgi:hypothetical protein